MNIIVPDASVILAWVLQRDDEPDYRHAAQILTAYLADTIEILLPTLWRYEVGNILAIKLKQRSRETMDTLLEYKFREEPLHREYCLEVLDFMREVPRISFYDASYHCLAIRSSGTYLTSDHTYVKRVRTHGHVTLVSEWIAPDAISP